MNKLLLAVLMLAACGGHKQAPTTPTGPTDSPPADDTASGGVMIAPEKMDEVQRDLQRKGMIISQCLAQAVDEGQVKKTTHGKVTLEIVITDGRASSVKVMRTTLEDKGVTDCVVGHVHDIAFPQMPKPYETSYTYAMEAN